MEILLLGVILFIVIIFLTAGNKDRNNKKTYIDENGYLRFRDSNRLVHRWVAEKSLGRKLRKDEVVHHKDRNKLNNSPSNLQVFANQDEHNKEHKKSNWYTNKR